MSQDNNGGPAFPMAQAGQYIPKYDGMSLRDYAAIHSDIDGIDFGTMENTAKFLGIPKNKMPAPNDFEGIFRLSAQAAAKLRYMYADAMLAKREKEPNT